MSLASGSSGNCYYLGTDSYGILIDAGIGIRTIRKRLKDEGIPFERVLAVFVTHDHADHIKSVGPLGENLFLPIYATSCTHVGINRSYVTTQKLGISAKHIEKYQPLQLRDFTIEAFEVPHDGTDNVGYFIQAGNHAFCFVTDLGEITPVVERYLLRAQYLIIEANYDAEMLRMGSYPPYLKERIASSTGHLCNAHTAEFLATHWQQHWSHIWLCHLSKDNNHPDLAYKTVELRLKEEGIVVGRDVELCALKRSVPSQLYVFE